MKQNERLGFIGLGNMGHPMAKNLEKAGFPLSVYNRSADKAADFSAGSQICTDIPKLVAESDIIFTMLSNDDAVHAVYETILQLPIAGKVFVDMSTISQSASVEIGKLLRNEQADFVDAPVAGSTQPAKEGTLIFMVGTSNTSLSRVKPYLSVMGKEVLHLGENGQGIAAKLCINYYLSILYQGMAETVLFAEKMGISAVDMMRIINESASGSGASRVKTPLLVNNEFPAAFALDFMLKDVKLAANAGANFPMSSTLLQTYQGAHDNGLGEKDVMAVIEYLRKLG
ncbi:NAD-binding protein [Sphingobacterium sp. DK4209]|uniref:NAD-binding protein n=1 Tax=Sphingobacterium zhuxiongii TaxID=2662364 RepID=A0A5Q0Q9K3_9SPHI|nr:MULTISPECIES: NAD(P)-dependent oxidoreductase [unclassified Sphingobacterium]MVZ65159.1 NAD-binding protein [Sphingobacterium sp. DK4209]QGA26106.1 NAD-binding protein [Sphingobacterium sp. dk4302]